VYFYKTVTDATLKATLGFLIGQGKANTNLMLAGCRSGAAVLAHSYKGGGKSDWYLPSYDEISIIWQRRFDINQVISINNIGSSISLGKYWSSTENGADNAIGFNFSLGTINGGSVSSKSDSSGKVRAIRAF